jgi:predicted phage terminase large subunit-like protein
MISQQPPRRFVQTEKRLFNVRNSTGTLKHWADVALSMTEYTPAKHHIFMLSELDRLSCGEFDRLMILMPPGSAKSTYASVLFPVWWFTQHPRSSVITASHSSGLAEYFSRKSQALIDDHHSFLGYGVSLNRRSADSWTTTAGGEYMAIGVRGAISGRRADLIVIDDPIKSLADAESQRQRDYLWEWYRSDITTRLKPKAKVILVMTRWHVDDLGGKLLAHSPDEWRVVRLPALAENGDVLGRSAGAALWPEWEDERALNRKRAMVGERAWASLFQQSPRLSEGNLFRADRLTFTRALPSAGSDVAVRAWDLAATGYNGRNNPDWTVGVLMLRHADGRFTIADIVRMQGSPHEVEDAILMTARRDGAKVIIAIPEDPGQAGKSQATYITRQLAGFVVSATRETGSKATRAMPFASQIEAGNVSVIEGPWNVSLINELGDFPWGHKDDQVDALVRAFTTLAGRPRPITPSTFSVFSR